MSEHIRICINWKCCALWEAWLYIDALKEKDANLNAFYVLKKEHNI